MDAVWFPANASLVTLSHDLHMLIFFSNYFLLLKTGISSPEFFNAVNMPEHNKNAPCVCNCHFFSLGGEKGRTGFTYLKILKIFHCTCNCLLSFRQERREVPKDMLKPLNYLQVAFWGAETPQNWNLSSRISKHMYTSISIHKYIHKFTYI